ncbi:hypothetical protein HHI36_013049, partial [Cryptolaemus montrouzieri]
MDGDRSNLDDEEELGPNNQDIQNAVIEFEDGVLVGGEQAQNNGQDHFSEDEADIQDPGEIIVIILIIKKGERIDPSDENNLIINEEVKSFKGNEEPSPEIMNLETPYSFFKYDDLMQKIVDQSNLYSLQINPNKPANIIHQYIHEYLGI